MTVKYYGKPEQFHDLLKRISSSLHIREVGPNFVRLDLDLHVVIHWWFETGTVLFRGPVRAPPKLQSKTVRLASSKATGELSDPP
jgi:hypothetical protein